MMDYTRFREINDLYAKGHWQKARHLLMEMQSRCLALRDEINRLRLRLQTAEDALFICQNLTLEGELYWLRWEGGRQGPFCPNCYEAESALIRLDKYKRELICPYCHESYPLLTDSALLEGNLSHARILRFAR